MTTGQHAQQLSRRAALGLIATGVGTVLLAACAPSGSAGPTVSAGPGGNATPGPAAAGAAPQPKTGGTLRHGSDVDVNRLDPHFRLGDIYWTVYDRLTQYDINHNVQPMLAESWDISADYTSIKFNLRKGVQFHNGAELDAAAVKFNSERARDLPNTQLDEAKWWTEIETPDKYTVIFKSDKPRPLAFDFFEFLNIAEPTAAGDPSKAVGTGPFKFVEWKQNDSLTLTKNPSYWQSGKPYLDGITSYVISDPQTMVARFEGGTLDAAIIPVLDFLRLREQSANYTANAFTYGNFNCFGVNCKGPPWDNKKARQALHHAIDRTRWANPVQRGLVSASLLPWPKTSPAYDEAKANAYPFDLDKAGALLKEAGVTQFTGDVIMPNSDAELNSFGQILQADFAKLGIALSLRPQDQASYLDLVNNWKYNGFWLGGGSFAQLDPATGFNKSRALSVTGNSSGFTAPVNAAAVELVGRANTEVDPAKRKLLYADLNNMLLDEAYISVLAPQTNRLITTTKVQGYSSTLHAAQRWWEAWLACSRRSHARIRPQCPRQPPRYRSPRSTRSSSGPASRACTCCIACAASGCRRASSRRAMGWAAPGTGIAIPARVATWRAWTTRIPSRRSSSRNGSGPSAFRPSPRFCGT
jgi:peptide/nickel transport system substrate-binding protein